MDDGWMLTGWLMDGAKNCETNDSVGVQRENVREANPEKNLQEVSRKQSNMNIGVSMIVYKTTLFCLSLQFVA